MVFGYIHCALFKLAFGLMGVQASSTKNCFVFHRLPYLIHLHRPYSTFWTPAFQR